MATILTITDDMLRCKGSGLLKLAPGFRFAIIGLVDRIALEFPGQFVGLKVNSCCRSKAHNAAVGGHPRSLHVGDFPARPTGGTCAIDLSTTDERVRALAFAMGWSIGRGKGFTHFDLRSEYAGLPKSIFEY